MSGRRLFVTLHLPASARASLSAAMGGVSPVSVMRALHAKVDRALARVGFPPNSRAYVPQCHARAVQPEFRAAGRAGHAATAAQPSNVRSTGSAYESLLGHGATYEVVATYPLR